MLKQGTEKWYQDRCGKVTASKLVDVLAISAEKWKVLRPTGTTFKAFATKEAADQACQEASVNGQVKTGWMVQHCPGKTLKAYDDYVSQLVCDRLTKVPETGVDSYQMQWGKDNEDPAIFAYEVHTGRVIRECEFIPAAVELGLPNYGASPDGLINMNGCAEIKCPVKSVRHLVCFKTGIPEEHELQMEGQLLATGREWVDYISFDPRFVGQWQHLQLFVGRYLSNPDLRLKIIHGIEKMEQSIAAFIDTLPLPQGQER